MNKTIRALVALAASAMVVMASPAQASFAGAPECTVQLLWPNPSGGAADCEGEFTGTYRAGSGPVVVCVAVVAPCSIRAHVDSYSAACPVPDLPLVPPLVGFANGTLHVTPAGGSEQQVGTFNWTRVGLTGVLLPIGGASTAGVAAFVPHPPFGTCEAPLYMTFDVIGVGAGP